MSQNTPESRAAWGKYGDILTLERPAPPARHPRMPAASRAKLFSPFAALRGFDDELSAESAQHRLRVEAPAGAETDLSPEEECGILSW